MNHYDADIARFEAALEAGGWIIEADGFAYISPDAPADLVDGYQSLMALGYATGMAA